MDIVQIIPNRIYSIRYDGEERAEYYRLFNKEWTDVDFLMAFFSLILSLRRMLSRGFSAMIRK